MARDTVEALDRALADKYAAENALDAAIKTAIEAAATAARLQEQDDWEETPWHLTFIPSETGEVDVYAVDPDYATLVKKSLSDLIRWECEIIVDGPDLDWGNALANELRDALKHVESAIAQGAALQEEDRKKADATPAHVSAKIGE